jgi:hypothetical protein
MVTSSTTSSRKTRPRPEKGSHLASRPAPSTPSRTRLPPTRALPGSADPESAPSRSRRPCTRNDSAQAQPTRCADSTSLALPALAACAFPARHLPQARQQPRFGHPTTSDQPRQARIRAHLAATRGEPDTASEACGPACPRNAHAASTDLPRGPPVLAIPLSIDAIAQGSDDHRDSRCEAMPGPATRHDPRARALLDRELAQPMVGASIREARAALDAQPPQAPWPGRPGAARRRAARAASGRR